MGFRWNRMSVLSVALVLSTVLATAALTEQAWAADKLTNDVSLTIYDAKKKKVGNTTLSFVQNIDYRFGEFFFTVFVSPAGFDQYGILYYESSDCSGLPLVPHNPNAFIQVAVVRPPGSTVYLGNPATTPVLRIVRSYAQFYAGSSGACINDDDAPSMEVVDAVAVINLDDKFTPPFTMK